MKADKFAKEIAEKIERFNVRNGKLAVLDSSSSNTNNRILVGVDKHDDEYYMDVLDMEPPRFALYRHVRMEKWIASGHEPFSSSEYDHSITQDELDYHLKWKLRRSSPEERYQSEKIYIYPQD